MAADSKMSLWSEGSLFSIASKDSMLSVGSVASFGSALLLLAWAAR